MKSAWYDRVKNGGNQWRFWWRESKEEVHKAVFGLVDVLVDEQSRQRTMDLEHAKLYGEEALSAFEPGAALMAVDDFDELAPTFNLIESAVDTIHSDITANRVRPMFLTERGNWKQQQRAKGLNRFVDGQLYDSEVHGEIAPRAALHALVFGTGVVKVAKDEARRRPTAENVFRSSIVVDEHEALNGKTRQRFERRWIDRAVLAGAYPKSAEVIARAPEAKAETATSSRIADLVEVREAWHLPSFEGADDGRHVIAVSTGTLRDEEWTREHFPFVDLHYKKKLTGPWGRGIPEMLKGHQYGINELLYRIHLKLTGVGNMMVVPPGADIDQAQITNEEWSIITATQPPHIVTPQSVPPDLFQELNRKIESGYSLVGVNMLSARSEIPAGLDGGSGKALRIYSDTKSKRFIKFHQSYESFHTELAKRFVELTKELEEDGASVSVGVEDGDAMENLKWSEVSLDEAKYICKVWPTNFLDSTPRGKLADLSELLKVFPSLEPWALSLMDFPDLGAMQDLESSALELARKTIESILYKNESRTPEPEMDLALTLKLGQAYLLRAKIDQAPEESIEALRAFLVQTKSLIDQAQPPQPPQQPSPGAPPMPPPMA